MEWKSIGIRLTLHWHWISFQLTYDLKSIGMTLVSVLFSNNQTIFWHGVVLGNVGWTTPSWIRHGLVHPNNTQNNSVSKWMRDICKWFPMSWKNSQLANWRWIGRFWILQTLRFWPKSRLLIGWELWMLASHWSRGPSDNFQRVYP